LSRTEYSDKVLACWLGKNIGGTLGAPFEIRKYVNALEFYDPVPDGPAPNDDLDLQLVWLKMLEDRGIDPSLSDFADYWKRYLSAYPWNEYGFCHRNLERGLMPPISGCFENYFVDDMGSPIRSEIWACIAPGDPQLAASMAWKDAVLDHAGGEGMYGEMFWAAVESAAFVVRDPRTLIQIGLAMIPLPCAISRVIREALWCSDNGIRWAEARERIATFHGHYMPCNATPNHGFTILGWLYGEGYGDSLCKAVNCGYDTDCTGATLGSVLGIVGGTGSIPEEWKRPIGDTIVLHEYTGKFNAPATTMELTDRVQAIAERFVTEKSDTVEFAEKASIPQDVLSLLFRSEKARAALRQDIHAGVVASGDLMVKFHYNGEPVLRPGIERTFRVSLEKSHMPVDAGIEVEVPKGWTASASQEAPGSHRLKVLAHDVADRNLITVIAKLHEGECRVNFTLLGPGEARGFASGAMIPCCLRCGGREGACICPPGQ
jgi:ADP-ribosylglycohydrolase